MKFLFVQPIFGPNESQLQRNIASIQSLGAYLIKYPEDVAIALGGWCMSDSMWDIITQCANINFGNRIIKLHRFDRNYGKAHVVNTLMAMPELKGFEYILSADSDILFLDTPFMFDRLFECARQSEIHKKKPFGLISCKHTGNNRHYASVNENSFKFTNDTHKIEETVVWPTIASGIGGGCWMFSRQAWDKQKGYRVQGVYAGDDAYFLFYMANYNMTWQVADSIAVEHPFDNDAEYCGLKGKVCMRDTNGQNKPSIEKQIQEMEAFWKSRAHINH